MLGWDLGFKVQGGPWTSYNMPFVAEMDTGMGFKFKVVVRHAYGLSILCSRIVYGAFRR
jgi:hypothetical protein